MDALSICLEDKNANPGDDRYMQCVALPGRTPGLCITERGRIGWKQPGPVACELWRAGDGRLVLYRPEDGAQVDVEVRRAGRVLVAPVGKPVILRHQEELRIGAGEWIVHVHGPTLEVRPPSPLRRNVRAVLAALALAGAAAGCSDSSDDAIEVRPNPPGPTEQPDDAGDAEAGESGAFDAEAGE